MSKDLKILCRDSYLELSKDGGQHFSGDNKEHENLLKKSCTLYVGNLSIYTTEEQLFELFSRCGDVRNVFMGLDKLKKTACGFCFVEYYYRADAENAMRFLNGTVLDDHIIHTDWDMGFREGRQYECREDFDAGREEIEEEAQAHDKRETPY
ncbi:nuclear cap-binding protein subunit 2-like [Molossus molossus]|uniref:Nuclear cap-binding protein subunit 2 n=1 Tax=Molossus molossus TaxID=27622 RepID=A0A7J8J7W9_MOLMO|nr:nuclear cap-binding protein subunit 2-like [Molossus molossus]KAF6492641.1 nuclear cap binding protein subunit 2 like [Molossus molossus]